MQALLDLVERALGRSWLDIAAYMRDTTSIADIETAMATGDFSRVTQAVQAAAAKFAADAATQFATAGERAAAWLNPQVDALVHFDGTNPGAARWAQRNKLDTVSGLSDEQRQVIRQVLVDGARSGANPRETARDIRDSLGLTPPQQEWLDSYRTALESKDYTNALGRELSHGWSDRAIVAAQRRDILLTPAQVDTAVERYRSNIIAFRAETIARTEGLKVAHQGVDESLRQAVASNAIAAARLEGVWNPGPESAFARKYHRSRDLTSQHPAIGEPFVMSDGARMLYPGDPAGGAKHCANCRCAKSTRLKRAA